MNWKHYDANLRRPATVTKAADVPAAKATGARTDPSQSINEDTEIFITPCLHCFLTLELELAEADPQNLEPDS